MLIFPLKVHLVALSGSGISLELLLSKGARADCIAFEDYKESPVHCACINAKPRVMLEALERYGANLKDRLRHLARQV